MFIMVTNIVPRQKEIENHGANVSSTCVLLNQIRFCQYINQQIHVMKYNSRRILNSYMFRH